MRRLLSLLLLASAVTCGAFAEDAAATKPREIITAALAAKGGRDRLLKFPAWHIKYREAFMRDGKEMVETGEAYEHLACGQARYETAPDDVIVVDGSRGWVTKGKTVTELSAGQVTDFQEYLKGKAAMLTLLPLLTDEWQVSFLGDKEVGGRSAAMLRITHKNKKWSATTYWEKKSNRLIRAQYPHKRLIEPDDAKRQSTTREARFSDFRAFEGIWFHTKLLAFSGEKQLGQVEFTAIEPLRQLPEGVIEAPK